MFVVIYRGFVPLQNEAEYRRLWCLIADYFIENRGAIGSRLHKTKNDEMLAYSCWPDKKTRDASWPGEDAPNEVLPEKIKQAIMKIKTLSSASFEEIQMTLLEDKFC